MKLDSKTEITTMAMTNDDQRRGLLGAINEVLQLHKIPNLPRHTLVHIILFGDNRFTQNQNRQILEPTLTFIHASERFL